MSTSERDERLNAILADYLESLEAGRNPDRQELLRRHPEFTDDLAAFFADQDRFRQAAGQLGAPGPAAPTLAEEPTASPAPLGIVRYFGDYELLEEIARGGMGVVYKARQVSLNRVVAVKMILAGQLAGEADVRRFRTEAQTAAGLQHPHIVAIHEVGEHEGQHYFSMDFVEGQSLADRLAGGPLPPAQAARYVEAVARAIQYAHDRRVLHRDLKPANILLDREDRPRVTDFGLARQIETDKGLTASGAVLGTPSYMPPEQASGQRDRMGPASDVYSLGAVLYELVTGRPPFRAATPLDTLLQVLEAEPAPPRLLNPAVGRDLETIILKCLAKEPTKRYGRAADLADDLKAFQEGRPIKARRPGRVERLARWAHRNRRSVALVLFAGLLTALTLAGAVGGWRWYDERRRGRLMLNTADDRFYVAEVLDDSGRQVMPSLTAPTEQPGSLPEGRYHLRLSALGSLSETFQFDVERGRAATYKIGLNQRRLWEPLEMTGQFQLIRIDGRTDIFMMKEDRLRRINGATGKVMWDMRVRAVRPNQVRHLAPVGPDLNGDGLGDIVIGTGMYPELLAVSGKDGTVLWQHVPRPFPAGVSFLDLSSVLPGPLLLDVDGDGTPDVIAGFICHARNHRGEALVQAVSGRSGKLIWSHRLQEVESFGPPPGGVIPFSLTPGRWQGKPVVTVFAQDRLVTLEKATGKPVAAPVLVPWPMSLFRYTHLPRFFDPQGDGEVAFLNLHQERGRRQDQQAVTKLVALRAVTGKALWERGITGLNDPRLRLHGEGESPPDWPLPVAFDRTGRQDLLVPFRVFDTVGQLVLNPGQERDWQGVERLDGRTGKSVWRRHVFRDDGNLLGFHYVGQKLELAEGNDRDERQPSRLVVGPDLNGDGQPDVCVAVTAVDRGSGESNSGRDSSGVPQNVYANVAALSGADGSILWRTHLDECFSKSVALGQLCWWQPGADGRRQLVVSLTDPSDGSESRAWVLDAATGKVRHVARGLEAMGTADLDGDGLSDLYGYRPHDPAARDPSAPPGPGKLYAFGAGGPETVRVLGEWTVAADFANDGRRALFRDGLAISSRDGRELWRNPKLPKPDIQGRVLPHVAQAVADLDGDGVPDLLVWQKGRDDDSRTAFLRAVSGRDGRTLWECRDLGIEFLTGRTRGTEGLLGAGKLVGCRDLDGDGKPELIFLDKAKSFRLVVVGGADGRIRWQMPLSPSRDSPGISFPQPAFADVDGTGVMTVFMPRLIDEQNLEVVALDGRNGRTRWRKEYRLSPSVPPLLATGRFTRGGPVEVVVCFVDIRRDRKDDVRTVRILNAADGTERWSWRERETVFPGGDLAGPVLADLKGDGRHCVCLPLRQPDDVKLSVLALDSSGNQLGRFHLGEDRRFDRVLSLHAADLMGDGRVGLVVLFDGRLHAFRDRIDQPLWTWNMPSPDGKVLAVRPGTVIVQSGNDVYGIAGSTGKSRWRCDGPGPVRGLLADGTNGRPAAVAFTVNSATVCREALPTDDAGRFVIPEAGPVPGLTPLEEPWLARPLPWAGLPRPWWVDRLLVPLFMLELALLWWLRRRRWALVVGTLALLGGVSVSAYWLWQDAALKDPVQYYTLAGWQGMVFNVAGAAGVLVGLASVPAAVVATFRRRRLDNPTRGG
jgi:outer membrane protein assembly factor BamB/tRNA A-37 threonylcarbamoyl transferase component Bud32